jgi:dolichol-phosphate mannosyltransferase
VGAKPPFYRRKMPTIAAVIPLYRCHKHVEAVLSAIGPEVSLIYCIDDHCPDNSGKVAETIASSDSRVRVMWNSENIGVGGSVMRGYRQALQDQADIIVKVDGDGQMNPRYIANLVQPLIRGEADYVKGNRFFDLQGLCAMPLIRVVGNAGLSFISKVSSGYWNLFDPTNGFTAIHSGVARLLPWEKIDARWFFESDLLFRLYTARAVVTDVPIKACYGEEKSNLNVWKVLVQFPQKLARNFVKRIIYAYILRDFNAATLSLGFGCGLIVFGCLFGGWHWFESGLTNVIATPGTVMIAALPIILGFQCLVAFLQFDVGNVPTRPLQRMQVLPTR